MPKKYLGDYDGFVHTDGYAGYNKLTKVTHCNCWAHVRRKFHEAMVVNSEDSIARVARDYCNKLFEIEAKLDSLTTEERFNKRLMQEKPVFEAFWSWAEKAAPTVLAKSKLGKAFEYAFKRISWQLFQKWRLCYLKQCSRECNQAIYCRQKKLAVQ